MTEHNAAYEQKCACCGRAIHGGEVGAEATSGGVTQLWCLSCWDNDPKAVEQFRAVPWPYSKHWNGYFGPIPEHNEVKSP